MSWDGADDGFDLGWIEKCPILPGLLPFFCTGVGVQEEFFFCTGLYSMMPSQLPDDNVRIGADFLKDSGWWSDQPMPIHSQKTLNSGLTQKVLRCWLNYKLFCLNRIKPEICFNIRAIQPEQGKRLLGFALSEAIPEGIALPNLFDYYLLSRSQRTINCNTFKTYKLIWIFPHQSPGMKPTFTISR